MSRHRHVIGLVLAILAVPGLADRLFPDLPERDEIVEDTIQILWYAIVARVTRRPLAHLVVWIYPMIRKYLL
jgi:hypothetical protein